jgi:hypothetical protein
MTRPTMDDPFDRRLQGFLVWQAEQLAGAPSANEITARLADQAGGRFGGTFGRGAAARLAGRMAWAFLILALLAVVLVAVAVIGGQNHRTSVVLPTASPTDANPVQGSSLPDPCTLLWQSEIKAQLAFDVQPGLISNPNPGAISPQCNWKPVESDPSFGGVELIVQRFDPGLFASTKGPNSKDVAGLGDAAYFIQPTNPFTLRSERAIFT